MDYYQALNVDKTASQEDIKKAYRRLASKHHPDKGGDTKKFQEIQTAYDVLSDPAKRQQYDNGGAQQFNFNPGNFGGHDINDIFRQFGFHFGGGPDPFAGFRNQRKNKDLRIEITLNLAETLNDQTKILNIKTTTGTNENVNLTIPRGVTQGASIKYSGLGDNMFTNLPRGDLYIHFNIRNDPNFIVQGLDLIKQLTIDCFDAILGCRQEITGLDGKVFAVQVPAGCQQGMKLKIPGEGLYGFQKDIKGNLYILMNISIPTNLNTEDLELVRTLANKG